MLHRKMFEVKNWVNLRNHQRTVIVSSGYRVTSTGYCSYRYRDGTYNTCSYIQPG
jgi:hypothetical protein